MPYLVIGAVLGGVRVYKYNTDAEFTPVTFIPNPGTPGWLQQGSIQAVTDLDEDLLFVAQRNLGIYSYRITYPLAFTLLNILDTLDATDYLIPDRPRKLMFAAHDNGVDSFTYDSNGAVTLVATHDPGAGQGETIRLDTERRLLFLSFNWGGVHSYSYDDAGNLTYIGGDDQGGNARSVALDVERRLLFLGNGSRGLESYSYDDAGNLTWIANATAGGGDPTNFWGVSLDTERRLIFQVNTPNIADASMISFSYDDAGAMTAVDKVYHGLSGLTDSKADAVDRMCFLIGNAGIRSFNYDDAGNLDNLGLYYEGTYTGGGGITDNGDYTYANPGANSDNGVLDDDWFVEATGVPERGRAPHTARFTKEVFDVLIYK